MVCVTSPWGDNKWCESTDSVEYWLPSDSQSLAQCLTHCRCFRMFLKWRNTEVFTHNLSFNPYSKSIGYIWLLCPFLNTSKMKPREAKWCAQGHTARNWWNKPHCTGLVRTSLEVWEQGIGRTGQEGNNQIPTKCTIPPTKASHLSLTIAHKIGLIIPILRMRNWSSERERTWRTTEFWLVIQSEWRKLISLGVFSSQSWIFSSEWQPALYSFPL